MISILETGVVIFLFAASLVQFAWAIAAELPNFNSQTVGLAGVGLYVPILPICQYIVGNVVLPTKKLTNSFVVAHATLS